MADRGRFGRLRQLHSGRWQVRYKRPDGVDRPAPETFGRKRDAQAWLVRKESEILAGDWIDPDAGQVPFRAFATAWVRERPNLRPKTVDLYGYLLRQHLLPTFGHRPVSGIRQPGIRAWRHALLTSGVSAVTVVKAYRLHEAIMNTAADDGMIRLPAVDLFSSRRWSSRSFASTSTSTPYPVLTPVSSPARTGTSAAKQLPPSHLAAST
jgi:integrase-like protein